ncbi:hypothetical protein CC1G_09225 [Coprinopsis cinerea okayama7|uniref:Integral membrane protein n=1 Tax=Coprinopsis cinerea (strain Okayama-7 / 130 / ATCC MYA-4618 / FGSC 9003) TaxID=240176 RepID=A8P4Z9_COPC7|nr:hypothetical protein CC1G_09225 [Coprinopsis cinerea okayama7\|eukprot:XP_001838848.1 hypothetical protein CC1G_09225 [Coprinopsis cinerea okayama7\
MTSIIEPWAILRASTTYTSSVIAVLGIGMQTFMVVYGLSTWGQSKSTEEKKHRGRYVIAAYVIFVLSGIPTCLDLFSQFRTLYYSGPGADYIRLAKDWDNRWPRKLGYVLTCIYVLLGHAYMIFRSYLLWIDADIRKVLLVPAVLYAAFTATSLACISHVAGGINKSTLALAQLFTVFTIFSVFLNIATSVLIIHRLIPAWRKFRVTEIGRNVAPIRGVAGIFIESGLALALCGSVSAVVAIISLVKHTSPLTPPDRIEVISTLSQRATIMTRVVDSLYVTMIAVIPQMINFRIMMGESFLKLEDIDKRGQDTFGGPPKRLPKARVTQLQLTKPKPPIAFNKSDSSSDSASSIGVPTPPHAQSNFGDTTEKKRPEGGPNSEQPVVNLVNEKSGAT